MSWINNDEGMFFPSRRVAWFYVAAALCCLLCESPVLALDVDHTVRQYVHRSWGAAEGLPQSSVWAMVQTPDGYLWLGTEEGLVRFDGFEFKVFSRYNSPVFKSHQIEALLADSDGVLWIGTEGGGVLRYVGGEFQRFDREHGLINERITSLAEDAAGRIWVGTRGGGVAIFDGEEVVLLGVADGLPNPNVNALELGHEGEMWVGTEGGVVTIFDDSIERLLNSQNGLPRDYVRSIYRDPWGGMWLGTDTGAVHLREENITVYGEAEGLPADKVTAILRDASGNLWMGTNHHGLARARDGRVQLDDSLVTNHFQVRALLEDREGSLWIGAWGGGLSQFRDGKVTTLSFSDKMGESDTFSVAQLSDGSLALATMSGLLTRDADEKTYKRWGVADGLPHQVVLTVLEARHGGLWVGTNGGLALFRDGVFSNVIGVEQGLNDGKIRSLLEAQDGTLWAGTREGGLAAIRNGEIAEQLTVLDGLPDNRVSALLENSDGSIILGTNGGLALLKGGVVSNLLSDEDVSIGRVFTLTRDTAGYLWVGTDSAGIVLYRDGGVTSINRLHGLPDDRVYSILPDDAGSFWMSSNRGIFSVPREQLLEIAEGRRQQLDSRLFSRKDGMYSSECNGGVYPNAAKTEDGRLWFGCVGGVTQIDPGEIPQNEVPPLVQMQQIIVDGEAVADGAQLQPGARILEFYYTGLSFVAPEAVLFSHKLEGFDDDWSEPNTRRMATYTSLPDGEYRLKVRAANSDGVWSEVPAEFSFQQLPHYYETWQFLLMVLVGIALLVGLVVRIWMRSAAARQQRMSQLAWARTREVLDSQVGDIRRIASSISQVARDMQEMVYRLTISTDQVASSVSETATTVNQLMQTGQASEERVEEIVAVSGQSVDEAEKGRQAVYSSGAVMSSIQRDATQIKDATAELFQNLAEVDVTILSVKEIADRSKILAINASIEAVKAGTHGTGFDVVARRMKQLALQSRESTMMVTNLLNGVRRSIEKISGTSRAGQERTVQGVELIEHTGDVVDRMADNVGNSVALARQISQSIDQQISSLRYIGTAVTEISDAVAVNSEISHEVEAGANSLNASIDNLLQMIAGWRTPERFISHRSSKINW